MAKAISINVFSFPESNLTVAEISGTGLAAYHSLCKHLHPALQTIDLMEACAMPNKFRVEVKPADTDVYNEEEGRKAARAKVLRNFHRSRNKAIARGKAFLAEVAKSINAI